MDRRQKTIEAIVTVDIVNGTTRHLQLQLPEELGDDIRFHIVSVNKVPGFPQQQIPTQLQIAEQSATTTTDGVRTFDLTFDKRFLGAVTLRADIRQPRQEDTQLTAPFVRVVGAIRQHGLVSFEASPDQQLLPATDDGAAKGLELTDSGLIDPPSATSGRRTALVYRYIKPDYSLTLTENRYDTEAVPSAV